MKKILFISASIFILTTSVQAQKKISELPVASSLSGTDKMVIVNAGATKQMSASVLMGAVNDTADAVRAYVDSEISNIAIGEPQITDASIGVQDINRRSSHFVIIAGGPKTKTTTSAGDSIVKRVFITSPSVGDVLDVKACFNGAGVGKMMVYNANGALVETMETPTLNSYTYGYIEVKIIALENSQFGISQKVYSWNNYVYTFTNTTYYYSIFTYNSYPQFSVRIKYNSTTIGFKCLWYTAELTPMHPDYSNNYDEN